MSNKMGLNNDRSVIIVENCCSLFIVLGGYSKNKQFTKNIKLLKTKITNLITGLKRVTLKRVVRNVLERANFGVNADGVLPAPKLIYEY